jgi:hypothetical protein
LYLVDVSGELTPQATRLVGQRQEDRTPHPGVIVGKKTEQSERHVPLPASVLRVGAMATSPLIAGINRPPFAVTPSYVARALIDASGDSPETLRIW